MDKKKVETGLKYTGAGMGAFFAGIPARDLTPAEVEKYGGEAFILALGMYEKPEEPTSNSATQQAYDKKHNSK